MTTLSNLIAYPNPQVIALHDGFYAFVEGHLFGPWFCKEYAAAGLQTEIRRAALKPQRGET